MRPRPVFLVLILLCVGLAGCAGPDGDPEGEGPGSSPTPAPAENDTREDAMTAAGRYVPWTLSDFWVFAMEARGFEARESRLVFYRELGPENQIGSETYEEALHQAVFGVNPLLGRVHKHLLSPHNRGEHAFMFPFHKDDVIRDGAQWTTTFYGRQIAFNATYDETVPTPDGTAPGFRIEGHDPNSAFRISHSYVTSAKWFTYMRVTDEEGVVLDLQLRETGTGYSGDAYFIRSSMLFDETLQQTAPVQTYTFEVTEDLVARYRVEGFAIHSDLRLDGGAYARLELKDTEGTTIWETTHEDPAGSEVIWPGGAQPSGPVEERPQWPPGEYTLELLTVGGAQADVVVVGTQDNSGSV